jgi:HTH-type transcriptional regulator/antitoxin HigA
MYFQDDEICVTHANHWGFAMVDNGLSPGKALQDALEARGWTQGELAEIIGRPGRMISEIIAGKRPITLDAARELAAAFDTTAEHWINLETVYQLATASPLADRIRREARLRQKFPVREMMKRGWIRSGQPYDDLERDVLAFFQISSLNDPIIFDHSARRNYSKELSSVQAAWLFRVHQLACALNVPKYSETRLRDALGDLELLMTEPEEIRHVPRILTACGVRFVIVEPIPGAKIDGVCFWLDKNRSPVISLSLKGGDQIDRFWFNLRHEIEHALREDGRTAVIIDDFENGANDDTESEKAANLAASDFCVPVKKMDDFIARHHPLYAYQPLIGFSRLIKRHPGIVAGQLQKRLERWDLFKKYQAKVRHIVIRTALTDGYGRTVEL